MSGITQLANATSFYYNLFSRDVMASYLSMADRVGWPTAFYELQRTLPHMARDIYDTMLGGHRAAWRFLLPIDRDASVLDFGCGLGAITLALAPHCKEVVAVDLTRERLTSLRATAHYYGLHNIQLIHGGDSLSLPFADRQFDVVLLNGVLEWLPESFPGQPRAVQSRFLQEVRRVLRPTGVVYIGIENRFAYSYFREREDHTGLYWSSLMPRFMANVYSRWMRGKPYRTYTYTYGGYRRLLRESGFPAVHCYSPVPDYRYPERIVDLDDAQRLQTGSREASGMKQRLKTNRVFLRRFGHSFSLVASPGAQVAAGVLDALRDQIKQIPGVASARLTEYRVTANGILVFCTFLSETDSHAVVRLPLREDQLARVAINATALRDFSDNRGLLGEDLDVPNLLFEGRVNGQYATVESRLPGVDLSKVVAPGRISPPVQALCASMLEFGRRTASSDPEAHARLVTYMSTLMEDIASRLIDRSLIARLKSIGSELIDTIADIDVPVVRTHGDLNLGNCLWDVTRGRLAGIVDWDQYSELALPGWDLVSVLLHLRLTRESEPRGSRVAALLGEDWRDYELELWQAYVGGLGLDNNWRSLIVLSSWVKTMSASLSRRSRGLDYAWVEANIRPVLEHCDHVHRRWTPGGTLNGPR